ncbi:hypothetical protein JTB14_009556 [Gonioctena quinquepunctata]|nr:hypothetical protein JTB14_009556 [Gonioctena quinquepunctata]
MQKLPRITDKAKKANTVLHSWELFMSHDVLRKTVDCTQKYICGIADSYKDEHDVKQTDLVEIRALVRLFYIAGSLRSSRLSIHELWATDGTEVGIFLAVIVSMITIHEHNEKQQTIRLL